MSTKEVELALRKIGLKVKRDYLVSFENVLQELYELKDNSYAIKNKIEIDKSIYAYTDFETNRKIKAKEETMRAKKKSRDFGRTRFLASKMFNLGVGNHLLSIQRRSRTMDFSSLMLMKSTLRNSMTLHVKDNQNYNKLAKVFFMVNFFQLDQDFQDKCEFLKFFTDFYHQIQNDFKQLIVIKMITEITKR
jgi:hypothetical protein